MLAKIFSIALMLTIPVAFGLCANADGKPKKDTSTNKKSASGATILNEAQAKQMAKEYGENAPNFRNKYRGTTFEITATVVSINNQASVRVNIDGMPSTADADVDTDAKIVHINSRKEMEKLAVGKTYRIEAKLIGFDADLGKHVGFHEGAVVEEVK